VKLTPTLLLLSIVVSACAGPIWGQVPSTGSTPGEASSTQTSTALDPTASPALGPTASPGETFQASPTPRPTPGPEDWKAMPVAPTPSLRMVEVYRAGLAAGRDPARFSKIGDCQNITTYFLASFDKPDDYRLGPEYAGLQLTIDHFAGSWARESLAVRGGLNVAAAMNPLWADPKQCNPGETPLACEIRVYNPSIVTISMEESWSGDLEKYDRYLRQIVEYTLSQNVVPILATRAEPDGLAVSINATVARVAFDYDVPLWNFWAAAYALPNHGLTQDGFHLTQARSFFDDPNRMRNGWPWRNLTALQAIDSVYRGLSGLAASPTAAPEPAGQSPTAWQDWPVVPNVHPEMLAVYERGIGSGNNPGAFSKIGDGEISTVWFLDHYDRDPANYELGQHTDLQAVIDQFAGSYGRVSMAAGRGFTPRRSSAPASRAAAKARAVWTASCGCTGLPSRSSHSAPARSGNLPPSRRGCGSSSSACSQRASSRSFPPKPTTSRATAASIASSSAWPMNSTCRSGTSGWLPNPCLPTASSPTSST
jgi:hypothetical protein